MKHQRSMLVVLVEILPNQNVWYRLSPKVAKALIVEQKQNHLTFKQMAQLIVGCYINVPLTDYYKGKVVIGVGKIKFINWEKFDNTILCTRSQFVPPDELKHIFKSYHYLRHDYSRYSRINIFVNLYNWRQKKNS